MIIQLAANVPKLAMHFDRVVAMYIKNYGAGNLRFGPNQEDLRNTQNLPPGQPADGIAQAAAAGFQLYFWSGDLWLISDQADPIVVVAPAQTTYIDRTGGPQTQPSDVVELFAQNDLASYR